MTIENAVDEGLLDMDDESSMLAHLLLNDVLLINSQWSHPDPDIKPTFYIGVICSDTFAYAYADCEDLPYKELPRLYWMWRCDPLFGPVAWCVARRKTAPVTSIYGRLNRRRMWDISKLVLGELLEPHQYKDIATATTQETVNP